MTYVIEQNIPLPAQTVLFARRPSAIRDTIAQMQVGSSVHEPDAKKYPSWINYAKTAGIKLASRKQEDGSIKLWRVA